MMSRQSDGADYDYGPYEDEYRGFDRAGDENGRGPVILFLALGVLIIFAGVVWNTYRQGVRPAGSAIPVVDASEQPYKRVAEASPDTDNVRDTDKAYYDLLEGKTDGPTVERAAIKSRAPLRRDSETLAGAPEVEIPAPPTVEQTTERTQIADIAEGLDPRAEDTDSSEVQTASLNSGPMRLTRPAETPATTAPLEPAPVAPATVSRFASQGTFQIQLAALRSETAAQDAWNRVQQRHARLFDGAVLNIQRADLEARGVFYRLRVGSFETRETASAFCSDYKAAGGDCIVVAASR